MKLFTEIVEDVKLIAEAKEDGGKDYFIEGVFLQGNIQNRNGRVYPMETLDKEVARYTLENVQKRRAYGELGHPAGPTINLERVSHMITDLKKDGDNYIGKAKIMDTPYGQIVKNLMKEGAQLGVSSRGMGTLKPNKNGVNEVQSDFQLATAADIVADPSAPDAYVRGVMESCEWVYNIASGNWEAVSAIEEVVDTGRRSSKRLEERKLELFNKFLNAIRQIKVIINKLEIQISKGVLK